MPSLTEGRNEIMILKEFLSVHSPRVRAANGWSDGPTLWWQLRISEVCVSRSKHCDFKQWLLAPHLEQSILCQSNAATIRYLYPAPSWILIDTNIHKKNV